MPQRRRTLAAALFVYGAVGVALVVVGIVVGMGLAARIERLAVSADDALAAAARTTRATADAFTSVDDNLDQAGASTRTAAVLAREAAGTLSSLAIAMEISIFGAQPLVGLAADFNDSAEQATELADALDGVPPFGRVTVLSGDVHLRTFRDEFGHADVLHWAGHAHAGRGDQDGLALHDGVFSAAMADQVRGRVDFPGLVFLNGCGSHDGTARLAGRAEVDGLSGLAGALLLGGTRHVVGTLWDVRDEVARHFALAAYGELQRGGTIGGALGAARDALVARWGEDSLLWASHVLYGDPTWRPEQPVNAELEDFSVLDGLEQKYRRDLLSPDADQRLMAAAMLLRLGDRSAVPALGRDLPQLIAWLSPDATQLQRRRAALVVQSLATAAGLSPGGPPDELPDEAAVRALYDRLAGHAEPAA